MSKAHTCNDRDTPIDQYPPWLTEEADCLRMYIAMLRNDILRSLGLPSDHPEVARILTTLNRCQSHYILLARRLTNLSRNQQPNPPV